MLEKILLSSSQNSSYITDLHRFTRSVSKEKLVRGIGLFFILATLFIQLLTAFLPNKVAATPSQNDLIPGGVSTKSQLVHDCETNVNKIKPILDYYGIDCSDLSDGAVISLSSIDYDKKLYSVGHLAYSLPGETPVNISGQTVYWRLLHGWDTNGSSTYKALKFKNINNKTFFILFTCGNLVSIGLPSKVIKPTPLPTPAPTPTPTPTPSTPAPLCQYDSQLLASDINCKPCAGSVSQNDALACLIYHKMAANLSLSLTDANNTTAKAGNVVQYKLIVTNGGKLTAKDFVIKDNVADILDYATLTDSGGGNLDANGFINFPAADIKPGETDTKTFTMTVKNPVPTTAPPQDDPQKFNSVMTNIYGDTINIKVAQPTPQVVVTTANTLPNTGPGTSVFLYALIATIAGYFYSNRKLQLKEAAVALQLANHQTEV